MAVIGGGRATAAANAAELRAAHVRLDALGDTVQDLRGRLEREARRGRVREAAGLVLLLLCCTGILGWALRMALAALAVAGMALGVLWLARPAEAAAWLLPVYRAALAAAVRTWRQQRQ